MLAESLLFGASVVTSTATRVLLIGDVAPPRPAGGQTTLALVLVVVVAVFVALLARLAAQKKKTEEAAAKILSMSENMLSLSSLPISRSQIGTYTLKEKLAEGVGFISYRAVTQHGEACDLKIPTTSALEDKTAVGRLEREASVLEGIDSPHVVRFKAFEKLKDRGRVIPILVTEPVRGEELAALARATREFAPAAAGRALAAATCLYTMSPDAHFVVDRLPGRQRAFVACGFSGHGFKFMPVMGRVLADLAIDGRTSLPIGFLAAGRFGRAI